MDVPTLRRPWWIKHPDVADFVRSLFGTMRIEDMPAAIAAKFGPDIAPRKSGVARYCLICEAAPAWAKSPRERAQHPDQSPKPARDFGTSLATRRRLPRPPRRPINPSYAALIPILTVK